MDDEKLNFTNNEVTLTTESEKNDPETSVEVECNKYEIIEKITEQVHKRHLLTKKNYSLQQKLAMCFSGSLEKDIALKNISADANEWTLRELLDSISAKEDQSKQAIDNYVADIESLKSEILQEKETLKELKTLFKESTENAALNSVNTKTGERFSAKEVKELLAREEEVSATLEGYQLHSIQRRHNLKLALEKKRNLAEGPIDFAEYEMMCIETQNNKEIMQPISEAIKNIMNKGANIVNVLSHLGQKLYLAQKEKTKALNAEKELEAELNEMRDMLFEERMKYNRMKHESKELQHKFILLQHPQLIEDYNEMQQKNEEAEKELQRLKAIYEEEMKIMKK